MAEEQKQPILDHEHLRLLSLFHYISGGLTLAFSCFSSLPLLFMSHLASNPDLFENTKEHPDHQLAIDFITLLVTVFGIFVILGVLFGIAQILSGKFLEAKKHYTFSFIVAIPSLLMIPYGTILGIMTLIVLARESVKYLYQRNTNLHVERY